MDLSAAGRTLYDRAEVLPPTVLEDLARSLGTDSSGQTATLVPFFGPTVGGESTAVDGLGLDLSRAMLAGLRYEWLRPFVGGETVAAKVFVDQVFQKGANSFGILVAEFHDEAGQLIQRQTATFIERGQA